MASRIAQKGYAYATPAFITALWSTAGSASDASDNSDGNDSDAPQLSGPPGKQLRMPPPSAVENDEDSDGYASVSSSSSSGSSSDDSDSDDDDDTPAVPTPQYPILGARARKRVRPSTSYSKQMAVYVRTCLLNLRHATEDQPDVYLNDVDHVAFREALRERRVERVLVVDSPPPDKQDMSSSTDKSPDDVGAVPPRSTKDKKRSKKSSSSSSKESPLSSSSKKAKVDPKHPSPATSSATSTGSTSFVNNSSSHPPATLPPVATSSSPTTTISAPKSALSSTVTPPTTSALSTSKHHSKTTNGASALDDKVTDSMSPAEKSPVKRPAPPQLSGGDGADVEPPPPCAKKPRVASSAAAAAVADRTRPPASFQIPANADVTDMDRGVCYLRASAKFLQQALLLSDLKAMYKALNDSATASKWSKDSISTLSQTAALVESTVGFFNKANDKRKVALSYKFGAIVMLTSYRLQHNMLYGYYSQLHAPGRSPDTGERLSKANEDPIRSLILKEMGAMMRGFEFWRRFEACAVVPPVLPNVRDPATVDLPTLWQDLDDELSVPGGRPH
ncbi:hypothetical protein AaE_004045 [Aphanomyces astaci]|uniref:Uncharacterized protein n=1 Tax=Aphanomyces astaci TaxID=112090 RepID=A0A6A5A5S6_APHAT|nr:hypothetical protein AaE_004045 [Aphanomyces astaci]